MAEKSRLFEALGVEGKKRKVVYSNIRSATNAVVLRINFFMLSELEIDKVGRFAFDAADKGDEGEDEVEGVSEVFVPVEAKCF